MPSKSICRIGTGGGETATVTDPRVAVGIINYGDYRHLPFCLDSVKCQGQAPHRIILLDNQSLDGPKR